MHPPKLTAAPILAVFMSLAATAQPLDSLLLAAFEHHPELHALQLEYEAALQKAPQASQLPNPQINAAIPALRPETRLGGQVATIGASQMFPWFGTLKAKEEVALSMAKTKFERIAAAKLDITYRMKEAYWQLHLLNEMQRIANEKLTLYGTLEKVALAKVESGKATAADALRIRMKIAELEQQLPSLEADKQRHYATINELAGNAPDKATKVVGLTDGIAILDYEPGELAEKIRTNHPLAKQLDLQLETSRKELALNTLEGKPTFGLGLDYGIVSKRTDADPPGNGRDILIPKASVSLPIYRKKYTAKQKEEQLIQAALEMRKEDLENRLLSLVQAQKAEYDKALLTISLMEGQARISKSVYDILLAEYSAKGDRFDELLQIQTELLQFEINGIAATTKTHLIKAKIEQLTGQW